MAGYLLDAGFSVDVIDVLPTPYGLVRSGVAPDHTKIKGVSRVFDKIASHQRFRFHGGLEVGSDITCEELARQFHLVVYATGTSAGRELGIPGESLLGCHGAEDFVRWYNGHPDAADQHFELRHPRVVVIGNGNVALDIARMLVLTPEELRSTDVADHALNQLSGSMVREVLIVGRRGPAQAAFTSPELRELGRLSRADLLVNGGHEGCSSTAPKMPVGGADLAVNSEIIKLLEAHTRLPKDAKSHRIDLRFNRSPVALVGDTRVEEIHLAVNDLRFEVGGDVVAVPTGQEEVISCGLVIRAIGYRATAIPGLPFDFRLGLIPSRDGRIIGHDGTPLPGHYTVGWAKRGPSGVIGTNKKCAADTFNSIMEDRERSLLSGAARGSLFRDSHVSWNGWMNIDRSEVSAGLRASRPRVKIVRHSELLRAARGC